MWYDHPARSVLPKQLTELPQTRLWVSIQFLASSVSLNRQRDFRRIACAPLPTPHLPTTAHNRRCDKARRPKTGRPSNVPCCHSVAPHHPSPEIARIVCDQGRSLALRRVCPPVIPEYDERAPVGSTAQPSSRDRRASPWPTAQTPVSVSEVCPCAGLSSRDAAS